MGAVTARYPAQSVLEPSVTVFAAYAVEAGVFIHRLARRGVVTFADAVPFYGKVLLPLLTHALANGLPLRVPSRRGELLGALFGLAIIAYQLVFIGEKRNVGAPPPCVCFITSNELKRNMLRAEWPFFLKERSEKE